MTPFRPPDAGRFEALFDAHSRAILGYALRRVGQPADAADVVAETFLVAWRRMDAVPADSERLWLYGVARRVLANHRRGDARRDRLAERLRDVLADPTWKTAADPRIDAVQAAMARLTDDDREILQLAFWEDLRPAECARVLGIPDVTARSRLHRARGRVRRFLDPAAAPKPAPTTIVCKETP